MQINIKLFGAARDIAGAASLTLEVEQGLTISGLLDRLKQDYPELGSLRSLAVARNQSYAMDDDQLEASDEIALIPPVSGG